MGRTSDDLIEYLDDQDWRDTVTVPVDSPLVHGRFGRQRDQRNELLVMLGEVELHKGDPGYREALKAELEREESERKELLQAVEGIFTGKRHFIHDWMSGKSPDWIQQIEDPSLRQRVFQSQREHAQSTLDDCFCRILIKQIPKMVSRALRLEPLVVSEFPREPVNVYLREATRAYLLGLFIASVALARSALEQALEEKVPKLLHTESKDKMKMLIKAAERSKLLEADILCLADEARKQANKVVHGKACKETEAFDILIKTRRVVHALYSTEK